MGTVGGNYEENSTKPLSSGSSVWESGERSFQGSWKASRACQHCSTAFSCSYVCSGNMSWLPAWISSSMHTS
ncbi:hypothetical protein VTJ83DRAFT_2470 [Remersonia thermophila]|uniref:Uncharacterized protein n=1 Tax=Remersonia thermophila TaxID=72144 RepID=A0ABR4DIS1_9PEZI